MNRKKSVKILSGMIYCYYNLGIEELDINIKKDSKTIYISLEGFIDHLDKNKIDEMNRMLNVTRQAQVEEYYWELIGENSYKEQLNLIGMVTDEALVEYKDRRLKVKLSCPR